MTKPAAIAGTFADLRTVKTRGVVQLVIEVPIEQGAKVVEAFGFPQPGQEVPVAVARLVEQPKGMCVTHNPSEQPRRNSQKWEEMMPSQQAALSVKNRAFQVFLFKAYPKAWRLAAADGDNDEDISDRAVKALCKIKSKRDLNTDELARMRWNTLTAEFYEAQCLPAPR